MKKNRLKSCKGRFWEFLKEQANNLKTKMTMKKRKTSQLPNWAQTPKVYNQKRLIKLDGKM